MSANSINFHNEYGKHNIVPLIGEKGDNTWVEDTIPYGKVFYAKCYSSPEFLPPCTCARKTDTYRTLAYSITYICPFIAQLALSAVDFTDDAAQESSNISLHRSQRTECGRPYGRDMVLGVLRFIVYK